MVVMLFRLRRGDGDNVKYFNVYSLLIIRESGGLSVCCCESMT